MTLLHAWYTPYAASFNGPGWTLSVEAFFYAVFPYLVARLKGFGDAALAVFCAVYVAAMSIPVAMHLFQPVGSSANAAAYYLIMGRVPLLHLPIFMVGVCLGTRYLKLGEGGADGCSG